MTVSVQFTVHSQCTVHVYTQKESWHERQRWSRLNTGFYCIERFVFYCDCAHFLGFKQKLKGHSFHSFVNTRILSFSNKSGGSPRHWDIYTGDIFPWDICPTSIETEVTDPILSKNFKLDFWEHPQHSSGISPGKFSFLDQLFKQFFFNQKLPN